MTATTEARHEAQPGVTVDLYQSFMSVRDWPHRVGRGRTVAWLVLWIPAFMAMVSLFATGMALGMANTVLVTLIGRSPETIQQPARWVMPRLIRLLGFLLFAGMPTEQLYEPEPPIALAYGHWPATTKRSRIIMQVLGAGIGIITWGGAFILTPWILVATLATGRNPEAPRRLLLSLLRSEAWYFLGWVGWHDE